MITEKYVDYLQYSIEEKEEKFISVTKSIRPIANYKRGYKQPNGTRIYFGHHNTDRALVVMSGITLHNMRADGLQISEHIAKVINLGANVSRLDLCLTEYVDDGLYTPETYRDLVHAGKCISPHAKHGARYIASVGENYKDDIETLYIGDMKNRGKRGIARCYDKGVELDLSKYMISRVEVEEKRDRAKVSAKRIAEGYSVASVLKTRLDFDDEYWHDLLNCEDIDMSRGKQINPNYDEIAQNAKRWAWLVKSVAPSIAKAIAFDVDNGSAESNLNLFNNAIEEAYKKLRDEEEAEAIID